MSTLNGKMTSKEQTLIRKRNEEWEKFCKTYKTSLPFWLRWILGKPDISDKFYFNQGYLMGYQKAIEDIKQKIEDKE